MRRERGKKRGDREGEGKVELPSLPHFTPSLLHSLLYFNPSLHSLRGCSLSELDLEAMRQLQTRVNLVPVIAKADTLTHEELAAFKQRVR